jgi:hypothetical protein
MQRSASACKSFIGIPRSFPTGTVSGIGHHRTHCVGRIPVRVRRLPEEVVNQVLRGLGWRQSGGPSCRSGTGLTCARGSTPTGGGLRGGSPAGRVGAQRPHAGGAPGSAGAAAESPAPGGRARAFRHQCQVTRSPPMSQLHRKAAPADPEHDCPDPGAQRVVKSQVDAPAVAAGQAGASRAANLAHER